MTGALLAFTPSTHEYRHPDGRLVPSVTTILRAVGVSTDFEGLRDRWTSTREAIDLKRDIGTALHTDAHAFDDDDLDWSTVDPRVAPYLRAWETFRVNARVAPTTRERKVFHAGLFYCGTLDGIFLTPAGKRVLIDIKTGDPEDSAGAFQTAAYEMAYLLEHEDEAIDERWAVRLCPDLAVPYRITNYSARPHAWRDGQKFQAFLTTYWEQAERRDRS